MKKNTQILIYVAAMLLLLTTKVVAQNETTQEFTKSIYTADSLKSGNSKDVLASFFQLAFTGLNSANKEFAFSSSPFAVMLRSNSKLNIDNYYTQYRNLRKLNFIFGLRVDSNFKFNEFSSAVKWAIVDERDPTTSKKLFNSMKSNVFLKQRAKLNKLLSDSLLINKYKIDGDTAARNKAAQNIRAFFNEDKAFSSLDDNFKSVVKYFYATANLNEIDSFLEKTPDSSLKAYNNNYVKDLKESIKMGWLWTIGFSDTTYTNQFAFSNFVFNTELNKGVYTPKAGVNNLELNLKAGINFLRDTLQGDKNLKRLVLNSEAGINWVIRDADNQMSYFELKLAAAYKHNFNNLYAGEERSLFTLNGTARVRIYNDIWVPFEIKWDPNNGNVLGLLSVKSNFIGLANLLK